MTIRIDSDWKREIMKYGEILALRSNKEQMADTKASPNSFSAYAMNSHTDSDEDCGWDRNVVSLMRRDVPLNAHFQNN